MFYIKLALNNLRKNQRAYLPFLISMIFLVVVTTMTQVIVNNPGMRTLPDSQTAMMMFNLGNIILLIFAVIFSIYTNSFLLKQRKKEIGLYNVLGLGKRELYILMFWENLFSFILVLVAGIISGIIFGRLGFLILKKMLGIGEAFEFTLALDGTVMVALFYALVFLLLFIINCLQISRTNPIQLLYGSKSGEKEPKSRWIMSIIGIICLAAGYIFAVKIQSPIEALTYFFVAIILVIIGTYSLFISGSITLLKQLKKRKSYYYQPNHFISVSNMIYRMKQNAAGLASICILSTMVIVTLTTTGSLYFGQQNMVDSRFTHDISVSSDLPIAEMEESALATAEEQGVSLENMQILEMSQQLSFVRQEDSSKFKLEDHLTVDVLPLISLMSFMTLDEYNRLAGKQEQLTDNEVIIFEESGDAPAKTISLQDQSFEIKEKVSEFVGLQKQNNLSDMFIVVLKDQTILDGLLDKWLTTPEQEAELRAPVYNMDFNIAASPAKRIAFADILEQSFAQQFEAGTYRMGSKDKYARDNRTFASGFLFLGAIFGVTFTLATALIIYYKQVSEGMDDQERFEILQKVGMSHRDVKKVIHKQVLMVFLFPLIIAVIHLAFAFRIICKLLIMFGLTNWHITLVVALVVVLIFAFLYFLVYQLTARSYYQIVERDHQ
ncbi:FtsX-like permease family protein [Enterococcus sp. 669A]|uniref:FtsX-like permease family protein n=1 Tax=Candidatus Enterococcus moelleringii TaxID=2815325 RepID=A0ABS3LGS0_9ENTE|nr:ABC transporter permease [Enterococcus sp. 669A]MBO1308832.1 FtsX-like permease family protein [Enterococcus sp. 669A]